MVEGVKGRNSAYKTAANISDTEYFYAVFSKCKIKSNFKFDFIPVGRYSIRISFIGYKTITIPNIAIESGKETFLSIEMEEDINDLDKSSEFYYESLKTKRDKPTVYL